MATNKESQEVVIALRKVIRAIDTHSRSLLQSHGLTGPQAMILASLYELKMRSARQLADELSLSAATITDIVKRLEAKQLITREVDKNDRRVTQISLSEKGRAMHESAPPLLQHRFERRFGELADWERHQLIASLQRVADLMGANDLDAAPILVTSTDLKSE